MARLPAKFSRASAKFSRPLAKFSRASDINGSFVGQNPTFLPEKSVVLPFERSETKKKNDEVYTKIALGVHHFRISRHMFYRGAAMPTPLLGAEGSFAGKWAVSIVADGKTGVKVLSFARLMQIYSWNVKIISYICAPQVIVCTNGLAICALWSDPLLQFGRTFVRSRS